MIILQYHEVFFRLAVPTAMPAHLGAYSLEKTSWYCNIIILLGVEEHPNYFFSIKTQFWSLHIINYIFSHNECPDLYGLDQSIYYKQITLKIK